MVFWVWFLLLSVLLLRFACVVLFYCYVGFHCVFVCSQIGGHLGCWQFLAALIICVTSLTVHFLFSWVRPRSGIAESYDNCMFVRNCQTVFQRGGTISHSDQHCTQEFQLVHILISTWYSQSVIFATLLHLHWYLICVTLVIKNLRHLSTAYWPFVSLLLLTFCLEFLPIFYLGFLLVEF